MFSDKRCEIICVFPYVVGIRIMSIHISCDMYLRLGLHVQIRLYYVLPYKAKISAQHGIGFILDRCIVYLRQTMPNLQKQHLLIFEIFNNKKCTLFFWNRVHRIKPLTSWFILTSHSQQHSLSISPIFFLKLKAPVYCKNLKKKKA